VSGWESVTAPKKAGPDSGRSVETSTGVAKGEPTGSGEGSRGRVRKRGNEGEPRGSAEGSQAGMRKRARRGCGREPGGDAEGGLRTSDEGKGNGYRATGPRRDGERSVPQQLPLPSTASCQPAPTSCHRTTTFPSPRDHFLSARDHFPVTPRLDRGAHARAATVIASLATDIVPGSQPSIAPRGWVPWLTKAAAAPVNEGDWGRGRSTSDCDPRPEQFSRPAATPSGASRAGSPRRRSRSSRSTPVVRYRTVW
jgi:hypothetical protein